MMKSIMEIKTRCAKLTGNQFAHDLTQEAANVFNANSDKDGRITNDQLNKAASELAARNPWLYNH